MMTDPHPPYDFGPLSGTSAEAPVKCLIVDDIPENLIALEALLTQRGAGVEVLKAQSGPEALELLLAHSDVALALLDVQMPGMSGFELAELMRGSERTRLVPLIFMTAGSREQNWQFKGYESGAVDFLYKPVDPHVLYSKAQVFFELHRRKQELTLALQQRTEALRLNEMFMAVLGHDLRTPLMSITAAATVLKRQPEEDKVAAMADRLLSSSQRMSGMIEDLLDVTRIRQAGGLALQPGPADMQELVQRILVEIQSSAPQRPIEQSVQGNPSGVWDSERLCQVMTNLLGNAVRHGAQDESIHVRLDGRGADTVIVEVANGGTIAPDLLPHLFDPFRGREPSAGRQQGLGLGLFIAQQIVVAHGGNIDVRSQDGATCFRVQLPRFARGARSQGTSRLPL